MSLNRSLRAWIFAVSVATLLAGCFGQHPGPSTTSATTSAASTVCNVPVQPSRDARAIHGVDAFAFMMDLVCPGGQPNARVPGTENHSRAIGILAKDIQSTGFALHEQNFTGSDYEALVQRKPNSQAHSYYSNAQFCSAGDRERMRGLKFTNLEGRGGTSNGQIFLFMAHWDSKRYASEDANASRKHDAVLGANDGAAGVGVLLDLALTLKGNTTPFEVRIFLDDGEDGFEDCHPLAGSMWYEDQMTADEKARVRGIVLLDMIGDVDSRFYKGCAGDTALEDKIWQTAQDLDVRQFDAQESCSVTDDHTPFQEDGMKGVDVISYGYGSNFGFPPYWHTTDDTPAHISPELLGNVAKVMRKVLDDEGASTTPIPTTAIPR